MSKGGLLPGVRRREYRPVVICDAHRAIVLARRRADVRDLVQLALLGLVDYLFLHFPSTHIPALTRNGSLELVALLNFAIAAHVCLSRVVPRWAARRIAATWCLAERARFFARERGEKPR